MRIDEFYNPENDKVDYRSTDDTRKPVLTLEQLNKLRKIREIKRAEEIEHGKFVRVMYSAPAQEQI
jgi:hypothetical protein